MLISEKLASLAVTAMVAGAILAGATAISPDVYHDLQQPTTTEGVVAQDSVTTTSVTIADVYHDL